MISELFDIHSLVLPNLTDLGKCYPLRLFDVYSSINSRRDRKFASLGLYGLTVSGAVMLESPLSTCCHVTSSPYALYKFTKESQY